MTAILRRTKDAVVAVDFPLCKCLGACHPFFWCRPFCDSVTWHLSAPQVRPCLAFANANSH